MACSSHGTQEWWTGASWHWRRYLSAGTVFFVAIAVARWPVIDSPPYYDFAIGLWPEADFLARTDFDYMRLRYQESHTLDPGGGARSYMTSALPTLVAVGMRLTPSPRGAIIAYHLFTFACAACVALIVYRLLHGIARNPLPVTACLAILTTPVFSAQIDLTGMDLPMTALALLAVACVVHSHFTAAAVASFAAFAMKNTGGIVTAALGVYYALAYLTGAYAQPVYIRRRLRVGAFVVALFLAAELLIIWWGGSTQAMLRDGPGLTMVAYWSPDVLLLALASCVLIASAGWRLLRTSVGDRSSLTWAPTWTNAIRRAITGHPLPTFSAVLLVLYCLVLTRVDVIPRYLTLTVPLLYLVIGSIAWRTPSLRTGISGVFIALVACNLANWDGRLFPSQHHVLAALQPRFEEQHVPLGREGSFLERSREFLADHGSNIRAMAQLEADWRGEPIIAGHPFTYFMALPSLGYVSAPLRGYSANGFSETFGSFQDPAELLADQPARAIFIWCPNAFCQTLSQFELPHLEAADRIVYGDQVASSLIVFEKRIDDDRAAQVTEAWYAKRLWPAPGGIRTRGDDALYRASKLAGAGRADLAIAEHLEALDAEGAQADVCVSLCRLANAVGAHQAEAVQWCRQLLERRPRAVAVWCQLVETLLRMGHFKPALESCQRAVHQYPFDPGFRRVLAELSLLDGGVDRAVEHFAFLTRLQQVPTALPAIDDLLDLIPMRDSDGAIPVELFHSTASDSREIVDLMRRGAVREARDQMQAAYRVGDLSYTGGLMLGTLELERGATVRAVKLLQFAANAEDVRAAAQYRLSVAMLQRGAISEAEQLLIAGVDRDPNDADTYVMLGCLQARTGRPTQARQSFKAAFELGTRRPEVQRYLQGIARQSTADDNQAQSAMRQRSTTNRSHESPPPRS